MMVKINGIDITGIASTLPPDIKNVDSLKLKFGEKIINRIKKSTGVESMHVVSDGVTASDLACKAAKYLLSVLSYDTKSIDAIVFASFSHDYKGPGTSVIMQDRLGLSNSVAAFDLIYGCSAYTYALFQAALLISSGAASRVLVCTGETQSRMINPNDRALQVILGDAGSATVVEKGTKNATFYFKTRGEDYNKLYIPAGGFRNPTSKETLKENVDENGNVRSKENLFMDGMAIMEFSLIEVPLAVNGLLNYASLKKENIDLFAFHQPNRLILEQLSIDLNIPLEKIPIGLQKTGNTGSASIPLLLSVLKEKNMDFTNKSKVVTCGFGLGLTVSAGLFDLSDTKVLEPIIY